MTVKNKERKKIVVLSGILLVLLVVLFMTIQYKQNKHDDAMCSDFSNTGEMIMEIRQNNVHKQYVIDTLLKDNSDEALVELVNTTVSEAYEVPLHDSVEDKEEAIKEFKDTSYSLCIKNM